MRAETSISSASQGSRAAREPPTAAEGRGVRGARRRRALFHAWTRSETCERPAIAIASLDDPRTEFALARRLAPFEHLPSCLPCYRPRICLEMGYASARPAARLKCEAARCRTSSSAARPGPASRRTRPISSPDVRTSFSTSRSASSSRRWDCITASTSTGRRTTSMRIGCVDTRAAPTGVTYAVTR